MILFTMDIAVDLFKIGVSQDNFPGMQIFSKGYSNNSSNAHNPSSIQLFFERKEKEYFHCLSRTIVCIGCGNNEINSYEM